MNRTSYPRFDHHHTPRLEQTMQKDVSLSVLLLTHCSGLFGLRREHVGLRVAEGGAVHQALLVNLVLHDRRRIQTQNLAQLVADARERRVRTVPHADHVFLVATGHHHAHHVRVLEGLADRSENLRNQSSRRRIYKILPQLAENTRCALDL